MSNWVPQEDFVIRLSDETGEFRHQGELDVMVQAIRDIANDFDFDLSSWGGWGGMRQIAIGEVNFLKEHETIPKPVGYKIVRGRADEVELQVEEYLNKGYVLNGPLFTVDANGTTIFVQGLVHYE